MDSKNIALALTTLDDLYKRKQSFQSWLSGNSAQEKYDEARKQLEDALPGLCIKYVDLVYRMAHVLAPEA